MRKPTRPRPNQLGMLGKCRYETTGWAGSKHGSRRIGVQTPCNYSVCTLNSEFESSDERKLNFAAPPASKFNSGYFHFQQFQEVNLGIHGPDSGILGVFSLSAIAYQISCTTRFMIATLKVGTHYIRGASKNMREGLQCDVLDRFVGNSGPGSQESGLREIPLAIAYNVTFSASTKREYFQSNLK